MSFTYLLINLLTIAYPAYAFKDERLQYYRNRKSLMMSILLTGLFFITWDIWFTLMRVWSFNSDYLMGLKIFSLPVEECLFFVTVPFACVFIYEVVQYFFPVKKSEPFLFYLSLALIAGLAFAAVVFRGKLYTCITCVFACAVLAIHLAVFKSRYLYWFYLTFIIHLLPFLLVNGLLTYLPVVSYNSQMNIGVRIGTIPVEDSVYSFLMLLMLISWYEAFKSVFNHSKVVSKVIKDA